MSAFKSDRISPTFWYYENHADRIRVWGNFWHLGKIYLLMGRKVWNYGKTHYHVRLLDQTCSPHWTSTAWLSGFWRVATMGTLWIQVGSDLPVWRFGQNQWQNINSSIAKICCLQIQNLSKLCQKLLPASNSLLWYYESSAPPAGRLD